MMEWDEEKEIEDLKLDLPGREALGSLMVIIVVHYTALLVTLTAHHNYWWQPNVLRLCIRHCVWTRCSWTTASTWRSCGEWGGKGTSHGGLSRGGIQSEAPNDHQQVADRYAKKTSQSRWTDQQNVSYQKFGLGDEDTFLYKVGLVFFFERMSKPILNPTVNMIFSQAFLRLLPRMAQKLQTSKDTLGANMDTLSELYGQGMLDGFSNEFLNWTLLFINLNVAVSNENRRPHLGS